MPSDYDRALVCENGHPINPYAGRIPASNAKFCDQCGAIAIDQCLSCNHPIKGGSLHGVFDYNPPAYCENCGNPHVWVAKRINAAQEYLDEIDTLPDNEKVKLKEAINALVRNDPQTQVAILRFKKSGLDVSHKLALRDILGEILSEEVKNTIWGAKPPYGKGM